MSDPQRLARVRGVWISDDSTAAHDQQPAKPPSRISPEMMTNLKTKRLSPGRKTILAIAVASTLVNGVASAADTVIESDAYTTVWSGDNITVNPNVSVGTDSDIYGISGIGDATLGTLLNHGTLQSQVFGY
ncbi:hypothetical protein [Pseudomonas sp. Marseille-Q8238]